MSPHNSKISYSYEIKWAVPYSTSRYGEGEGTRIEITGIEVLSTGWISVDYEDGVRVHYPPQAFYYVAVKATAEDVEEENDESGS